ncbi:SOUL family heme-binding protein [Meridianimarinicoccus roseus]|nr:heme-binding protein [Meridianimarinicoccus roseus]
MSIVNHTTHLGMAALLLAAGVAAATEARMYKGYETPAYDVLEQDGAIELRRYAPHVVAEVQVEGSRRGAVGRGFRTLAGYIFGDNADAQKVAMTAPVAQISVPAAGDAAGGTALPGPVWTVRFTMPSDYDVGTLPVPADSAIRLTRTAPQTQAVIRFSGFWSDRSLNAKADALQAWAEARGLTLEGSPRYYFYDDPFTLPFNRRNEVAFVVR